MSYKLLEKNSEEVKIEIKLNAKEFEACLENAYQKSKNKYNIQGFRKGKVPRSIIEKNYGETVFYEDAINEGLSKNYAEFLKANEDITPFTWPEIDVKSVNVKGLEAVLTVALAPTVTLGDYKGLKVPVKVNNVEEEEIEHALFHEREKMARLQTKEGKAELNDITNIDFEGFVDGKSFEGGKAEGFDLTLGSGQFIPGFEDQLVGLKAGEEKDVKVKFPEDYGAKNLAGKEAVFKCKVNEVKEKILPELNDDFAKDVSEFNTFAEYKESIKKELEKQKEKQASIELENKIVEKIIDKSTFTIAPTVVEEELSGMMQDLERSLAMQGLSLANYLEYLKQDEKSFRESRRSEAERMIKTRLVFTEIIKKENITVNDDDCILSLKRQNPSLTDDNAKKYFEKLGEDRKNALKNDAMIDKILSLLKNENA